MKFNLGETTHIYKQLVLAWRDGARHVWLEGGTAASKTYSVLQLLTLMAAGGPDPLLISTVSETTPHLKRGCIRDFQKIMGEGYREKLFNRSDLIYNFGKSQLEFFSADQSSKLRGARRDILFINEANNISYEAFRELDSRTNTLTICDWNPVSEFWYHLNDLGSEEGSAYIHATYLDALNVIHPEVIKNILAMGKRDPNWANIYLAGKLGKIEGLVYPYFDQEDTMPVSGVEFYGLDFGYSIDMTAFIHNLIRGDELHSEQLIYERGLTNPAIAARWAELGIDRRTAVIFADSAEPKSIAELCDYGWNVKPCPKGADSVEHGHQLVRQFRQYWTKASIDCIKEQRNFRYLTDKNGLLTNATTHIWSHGMDGRRYGVLGAMTHEIVEEVAVYDSMQLVPDA